MTSNDVRHQLLERLAKLLTLAPQLRLGQLLCHLTSMACPDKEVNATWEARDAELLEATAEHYANRHDTSPQEAAATLEVREKLFEALTALCDCAPELPLALIICHLTFVVHGLGVGYVWDIEDEDLLMAAERQLHQHQRQMKSADEARAAIAAYVSRSSKELLQSVAN